MSTILSILIPLAIFVFIFWLGLMIPPRPFKPFSAQTQDVGTFPLPDGLPPPVERFYRTIYGDRLPVITSAVISGRARMRLFGVTFQGRFRFTHQVGKNYRHYIETTIFGLPLMKVNESYLDGRSRLELPFGVVTGEPKIEQAANLGMWGETFWMPSVFLRDPRLRWEPVDEHTALLLVPFGEEQETFVARFDPQSGTLRFLEAMRYKDANDVRKTLWINEVLEWKNINGNTIMAAIAITWFDEGTPWAVFRVDELVYNADVSAYVRARGL